MLPRTPESSEQGELLGGLGAWCPCGMRRARRLTAAGEPRFPGRREGLRGPLGSVRIRRPGSAENLVPGRGGAARAADAMLVGELADLARDPVLIGLRGVGAVAVRGPGTGRPVPGAGRAARRENHSRVPGRRCSTMGVTWVAPVAAICPTAASSWAGESDRNGTTGPMRTPQRSPRSFSAAHASSRRPGAGVPGSIDRHRSLSTKPADTLSPTSVTSAASASRSMSLEDQGALGQDGERVGSVPERSDDAGHQLVAPLRPLVAVHVHAHRDVLALPARRGHLLADQLWAR